MRWRFSTFVGDLRAAALTSARNWVLPDRSGTIVVDGGSASTFSPTVSVTANKTLALSDLCTRQDCTNTTTATITVPLNSTAAFPIGATVQITKRTVQNVLIGAEAGVTILGDGTTALTLPVAVVSSATLLKTGTDTWYVIQAASATGRFTTLSQTTPTQARVNRTAAHSLINVLAAQKLDYDTIVSQSPAGSLSSSGRFTVTAATSGIYLVNTFYSATSSAVCTVSLSAAVNSVFYRTIDVAPSPVANSIVYLGGSSIVHLQSPGDYVDIVVSSNATTNLTSNVGPAAMYFDIVKLT